MLARRGKATFWLLIATVCACAQYVPWNPNGPLAPGVKGAPFSADVVSESVQTLSDGTHITSGDHGRAYRDSLGRTRQETYSRFQKDDAEILTGVRIIDPVQRLYIFLNPQDKSADVRNADQTGWRLFALDPPPARRKLPEEEDLGTKVIEGFTVTGKRYTHIVEAGRIGNDKPFADVYEDWFSPALKMVVMTATENPRDGRVVWKLANIETAEPDPALFQIPPDYTVTQR